MEKRGIRFGEYDTARLWTLCEWHLTEPEQQTNYVNIIGGVPLNLSTALTDGEPGYNSRTLTARLECSEGTRLEREDWIADLTNELDGYSVKIVLPDKKTHYLVGQVQVKTDYNNLAHASVSITATCEPWFYRATERTYTVTATAQKQTLLLTNTGRRALVPTVTVEGANVSALVEYETTSYAMNAGTYELPGLYLRKGDTLLTYSGSGVITITYREAVLR